METGDSGPLRHDKAGVYFFMFRYFLPIYIDFFMFLWYYMWEGTRSFHSEGPPETPKKAPCGPFIIAKKVDKMGTTPITDADAQAIQDKAVAIAKLGVSELQIGDRREKFMTVSEILAAKNALAAEDEGCFTNIQLDNP